MILGRALILWIVVALLVAPLAFAATGSTWLGPDTVTRIAREWLLERLGPGLDPSAVEIAGVPRELLLPAGDVAFATTLQSGSVAAGFITVLVEAAVTDARGSRTTRSATVNFRVNPLQDVVIAVRELGRRAVITAGDVRVERRLQSRLPANAVRDVQEVLGREVTRPLAPGEIVTAPAVTAPMIIRRGSVVSVVVEGANFKIVARGVAAEDGAQGAPIRVVNAASRREVVGRVEDERTVRIPF
jgi:flagella basal body P-ring formation protein FlgA